jgi:hypothetical protein
LVGLINKEICGKPDIECHAGRHLELSVAPSLYGQGEILRTEYVRSIESAFAVKEVHIAMFAALADLMAAMPRIPDNHYLFLFYTYVTKVIRK